jgi:hypothetical protein
MIGNEDFFLIFYVAKLNYKFHRFGIVKSIVDTSEYNFYEDDHPEYVQFKNRIINYYKGYITVFDKNIEISHACSLSRFDEKLRKELENILINLLAKKVSETNDALFLDTQTFQNNFSDDDGINPNIEIIFDLIEEELVTYIDNNAAEIRNRILASRKNNI